jgi:hypothetical protein
MAAKLGKILLPQAPRVANDLSEYVRNVEVYARQVEQTFRQVERWANEFQAEAATLMDIQNVDLSGSTTTDVSVIQGPEGRAGLNGLQGQPGANGATWRDGSGAPSNGLGVDGDYYLNDSNGDVYKKVAGSYSVVGNIRGLQGIQGPSGSSGPMIGGRMIAGSNTQSISNGVDTEVTFNSVVYDTNSMTGVANTFTVQTAGYYLFTAQIRWPSFAGGIRRVRIVSSTGVIPASLVASAPTSDEHVSGCAGVMYAPAAMTLTVRVYQSSGVGLGIGSGSDGQTSFTASRLGA